jgi:hypothetical protein
MDKVIREVELEGIGSRRPFFIDIEEGDLTIMSGGAEEKIMWSIISENKLGIESGESVGDPGPLINEGNLKIRSTKVGQGYQIELWLEYKPSSIDIESELKQLKGKYNLVIEHRKWTQTDVDNELVNADKIGKDYVKISEA